MSALNTLIEEAAGALQSSAAQGVPAGLVLSGGQGSASAQRLTIETHAAPMFRAAFLQALDALGHVQPTNPPHPPTLFLVPPHRDSKLSMEALRGLVMDWTDTERTGFLSPHDGPLMQVCAWSSSLQPALAANTPPATLRAFLNDGDVRAADHGIFAPRAAHPEWRETLARFGTAEAGFTAAGAVLTGREAAEDLAALDEQMLALALTRLSTDASLRLSVNASRASLTNVEWLRARVAQLAETSPSMRARLAIEVTETPAVFAPRALEAALDELKALGVRVWLDDIGTGATALNDMQMGGIAGVKLDRALSQHAFAFDDCFGVMRGLSGFAARRGLDFIVEGVENTDQRQQAEAWGASHVQGFFAGRPVVTAP